MSRMLATALGLMAFTLPAFGSGTPMDQANYSAWISSDIVVTDLSGKVLEVWKGGLKVGDTLPVDKEAWEVPAPLVIQHGGGIGGDVEGKKVTANRVILFLSKADGNEGNGAKKGDWLQLHPYFLSAGDCGVYAAVYAREKDVQPVYAVTKTEAAFKKTYLPIAERRTALDAALAETDAGKRAKKLQPFATDPQRGTYEAIEGLTKCGEAGVPALAAVLNKTEWGEGFNWAEGCRERALNALVKIGKPAADELVKFLEEQRVYWKLAAPHVRPDWYNSNAGQDGIQMRALFAALSDPAVYADVPADKRAVFRDLHDLWANTKALATVKTGGDLHPAKMTAAVMAQWEKK